MAAKLILQTSTASAIELSTLNTQRVSFLISAFVLIVTPLVESCLEYNARCTEDYIGKVNGISDQAKDKLRCRILADLVRLGEDIVNVPAGVRINACQRQLQEAVCIFPEQ